MMSRYLVLVDQPLCVLDDMILVDNTFQQSRFVKIAPSVSTLEVETLLTTLRGRWSA